MAAAPKGRIDLIADLAEMARQILAIAKPDPDFANRLPGHFDQIAQNGRIHRRLRLEMARQPDHNPFAAQRLRRHRHPVDRHHRPFAAYSASIGAITDLAAS